MSNSRSRSATARQVIDAPKQVVALARLSPISRTMIRKRLTYLSPVKLRALEGAVREIDASNVPGDIVEFGVALGGVTVALAVGSPSRAVHGFDVFGRIPAPSARDGDVAKERFEVIESGRSRGIRGDEYYGYMDDVLGTVRTNLATHGIDPEGGRVSLHQGLFDESWPGVVPQLDNVALAHVDCDWHDPVAYCLAAVAPLIPVGGIIVVDDYVTYEGARAATDAFIAAHPEFEVRHLDENLSLRRVR
ncbi:TylF/MycF/NovP-related O-methyltransferase [Demequina sp.]|uniref:TylF/MycF/NovP-related O-methyltransferase n=1 Tax=Demequina sp. TaxID=2050685 RepID=UPI003A85A8AC